MGWFPREELAAALERWPDLDGELADADGYCRRLDARLRELVGASARRPVIAPLRVGELIEYADREGLHPADASTRAGLSVELDRLGETVAWPPARNELLLVRLRPQVQALLRRLTQQTAAPHARQVGRQSAGDGGSDGIF